MTRLMLVFSVVLMLAGCGSAVTTASGDDAADAPSGAGQGFSLPHPWVEAASFDGEGSTTEGSRRFAIHGDEQCWLGDWSSDAVTGCVTWYFVRVGDGTQDSFSPRGQGLFSAWTHLPAATYYVLTDATSARWSAVLWERRR